MTGDVTPIRPLGPKQRAFLLGLLPMLPVLDDAVRELTGEALRALLTGSRDWPGPT